MVKGKSVICTIKIGVFRKSSVRFIWSELNPVEKSGGILPEHIKRPSAAGGGYRMRSDITTSTLENHCAMTTTRARKGRRCASQLCAECLALDTRMKRAAENLHLPFRDASLFRGGRENFCISQKFNILILYFFSLQARSEHFNKIIFSLTISLAQRFRFAKMKH